MPSINGRLASLHNWLLLLAIGTGISAEESTSAEPSVVISPLRPIALVGSTAEFSCTLVGFPSNVTSSMIRFIPERLPQDGGQEVDIIDDVTARMRYPNVQFPDNHGHVFCHVEGSEEYGQVMLRVIDVPRTPVVTGCVVMNWKTLECSWEPGEQNTGLSTNQTLYWRIHKDDGWSSCPHFSLIRNVTTAIGRCQWESVDGANSFKVDKPYSMFVVAAHSYNRSVSRTYTFNTALLVRPNHVTNVTWSFISSTSAVVGWRSPEPDRRILFRVRVRSQWHADVQIVNTSATFVHLTRLEPFTRYHVTIGCIPLFYKPLSSITEAHGFWSEPMHSSGRTLADVPGEVPLVSAGSYRFITCTQHVHNSTCIQLHWQPVELRLRHGNSWAIRIRYRQYPPGPNASQWNHLNASGDVTSYKLSLPILRSGGLHEILIDGQNEVGFNSSLFLKPIFVSSDNQGLLRKDYNFTVSMNTSSKEIVFKWTSVEVDGCTVYWCTRSPDARPNASAVQGECDEASQLNWIEISNNSATTSGTFTLHLPTKERLENVLFAMSFQTKVNFSSDRSTVISTGLTFNDCTFNVDKDVQVPLNVRLAEYHPHYQREKNWRNKSLMIEWTHPVCNESGQISHFIVNYCRLGGNCIAESKSVLVERSVTSVVLSDVEPDAEYEIRVKSLSFLGESNFTLPIVARLPSQLAIGFIDVSIASILVSLSAAIACLLFVSYYVIKRCRLSIRKFSHVMIVPPAVKHSSSHQNDCKPVTSSVVHASQVDWTYQQVEMTEIQPMLPHHDKASDIDNTKADSVVQEQKLLTSLQSTTTQQYVDKLTATYNDSGVCYQTQMCCEPNQVRNLYVQNETTSSTISPYTIPYIDLRMLTLDCCANPNVPGAVSALQPTDNSSNATQQPQQRDVIVKVPRGLPAADVNQQRDQQAILRANSSNNCQQTPSDYFPIHLLSTVSANTVIASDHIYSLSAAVESK